jgi:hypothetical protein
MWCAALMRIIPHYRRNTATSSTEETKALPAPEPALISPLEKETKVTVKEIMASTNEQEVSK